MLADFSFPLLLKHLQLHEGLWPQPGLPGAVVLPLPERRLLGGHLSDLPRAAGAQPVLLRPPPAAGLRPHLQADAPPQAGALPHQDRGRRSRAPFSPRRWFFMLRSVSVCLLHFIHLSISLEIFCVKLSCSVCFSGTRRVKIAKQVKFNVFHLL